MALYLSAPNGATLALRAPRYHLCYRMPAPFEPPSSPEAQHLLAERVADWLALKALTPLCREVAHNVWMCAFLHGADRVHSAATYEQAGPGRVAYVPRNAELALFDWPRNLLYLSGPKPELLPDLLPTFNGLLFPKRRPAAPFLPLHFNLHPLRLLGPEARNPTEPHAPWRALALKSLTWQEPGEAGALARRLWPGDGFTDFEATGDPWPRRLRSVGMTVLPREARRASVVELFQGTGRLRAALSPATLPALAELLAFVDVS